MGRCKLHASQSNVSSANEPINTQIFLDWIDMGGIIVPECEFMGVITLLMLVGAYESPMCTWHQACFATGSGSKVLTKK